MFEPKYFSMAVNDLKDRFYTPEEFPFADRNAFPKDSLNKALKIPEKDIDDYSRVLCKKELEALLLDFADLKNRNEYIKISSILLNRFSDRFFRLYFSLYQVYFENDSMNYLAESLSEQSGEINLERNVFFQSFVKGGVLLDKIASVVNLDGRGLEHFFRQYGIRRESPLALRIGTYSLKEAGPQIFIASAEYLLYIVENAPISILRETVEHYLVLFDVRNHFSEVNKALQRRFGDVNQSLEWSEFSVDAKVKFEEWVFIDRIMQYTGGFPKKKEIFIRFAPKIISSNIINEASVLVLDFGDFVIVDFWDLPFSHLYGKEYFEKEIRTWKKSDILPSFFKRSISRFSGRDYIIEAQDDFCFTLYYEGVDLFYTKEMLEIKTGMEPDIRGKKWH